MNGMPNDEAYLLVLRADLKAKAEAGDLLGALEKFSQARELEAALLEEAAEKDLKYLSSKLPEAQWATVSKALTFDWTFGVHYGDGSVEMDRGGKRMVIQEDGSYSRS